MRIRQISIYLENKPKQLSAICRTIADAGVNIATLSLADTSDFGIVRMIVDDHEKAKQALVDKGYVANVREVIAVCVPDRPGGMAGVMEVLDDAEVNIEYSYAMDVDGTAGQAVLIFSFADNDKAEKALASAGYVTLSETQVAQSSK